MEKLTDKQLKFINEYMIDLNATQAAIRSGYSKKTAQRIGSENLFKPLIKNEIEKRKVEASKISKKTREDIISDLTKVVDQFLLDGKLTGNSLKAIEILLKLNGWNEADKIDITVKEFKAKFPSINDNKKDN